MSRRPERPFTSRVDPLSLAAQIAALRADLDVVCGKQNEDLAAVVRRYLTCRHQRYAGVQRDIENCLHQMAVLAGWWPDDD